MGNHPSKNERPQSPHRRAGATSATGAGGNRPDADPASPEARRETKPEREARKLEKERAQRAVDRERSIREEHVDGGYLVTLGTYTGTEDFSKPTVRRLQIERRLAPFWRGLQDHEDDWKDNQLIAAVQGLPIPPPEDNIVYPRFVPEAQQSSSNQDVTTPDSLSTTITTQSITIPSYSESPFNNSPSLSPSHPAFSSSLSNATISSSPTEQASHKNPLFRGRAKTLASLASLSRHSTQQDSMPPEKQLPRDPCYNGVPLEAALYKNATECPICFMYYPPYLNQTRCCDQPICSECFVQIKRPDPHIPEHADPSLPVPADAPPPPPESECQLISEPATCPFCKTAELGVTYEPPPFRRGLTYGNTPAALRSAMSSASSISSQGQASHSRRRNLSISADAPNVVTTDKVRPDWSKKLSDARAQAQRRATAATALHNAAFVINMADGDARMPFGRRRRTLFGGFETPQIGGAAAASYPLRHPSQDQASSQEGQADLFPGRTSSRRTRMEELEEMMLSEAIRQSMQMEDERKKKEDKEAAKKDGKKGWRPFEGTGASNAEASTASSAAPALGSGSSASTPGEQVQAGAGGHEFRSLDEVIGDDVSPGAVAPEGR